MRLKRGFTLVELLVCVSILLLLVVIVWPEGETAAQQASRLAAERFESDVSYARSYSITRPDDPAVIVIDGLNNRYWLAPRSDKDGGPDKAIKHPAGGFRYRLAQYEEEYEDKYVVQFGTGGMRGLENVTIHAVDAGADGYVEFDGTGTIVNADSVTLQFEAVGMPAEVIIDALSSSTTLNSNFTKSLPSVNEIGGGLMEGGGF